MSSNDEPFDFGGGDFKTGPGNGDQDKFGLLKWLRRTFPGKKSAALATFVAGLVGGTKGQLSFKQTLNTVSEVASAETPTSEQLVTILVGFASNPIEFVWAVLIKRLTLWFITTVLWLARSVLDVVLLILVGDSVALQTLDSGGRIGLSDLGFVLLDAVANVLVMLVTTYFDVLVWVAAWSDPSTGTLWDGVIRTLVLFLTAAATLWFLYRLLNALADSLPGLSGIQTFITGGS